jgi:RimJ/RimL family protein N-acetyltransferase
VRLLNGTTTAADDKYLVTLGTEATHWVVDHVFTQLNIHRVSLVVLSDNPRAMAVYRKVCVSLPLATRMILNLMLRGFVEEGRIREANFQDGKWWDVINMGILAREWQSN